MKETIEEAIDRLEYVNRAYDCNNYYSRYDLDCIQILLSDYKRVLEINEVLLKENEELKNIELKSKGGAIKVSLEGVLSLENKIKQLEKENEELKFKERSRIIGEYGDTEIHDVINKTLSNDYISVQKVKDKIKKEIKYHEKNILDIENITMLKGKTAKEEAEIEFNKYAIVVLKKMLQELLEGRK